MIISWFSSKISYGDPSPLDNLSSKGFLQSFSMRILWSNCMFLNLAKGSFSKRVQNHVYGELTIIYLFLIWILSNSMMTMFPPILKFSYIMGIVILTLCWLNYYSSMLNCLYLLPIMYIDDKLCVIYQYGSRYEYLVRLTYVLLLPIACYIVNSMWSQFQDSWSMISCILWYL